MARRPKAEIDQATPTILDLHQAGKTVKEIAEQTAISHVTVTKILNEYGIETPRKPRKQRLYYDNSDRRNKVVMEWKAGKRVPAIAKELKISPKTIRKWLTEAGIYDPERDTHPLHMRFEQLKDELHSQYKSGMSVAELALKYDFDYEYLYEVMRRRSLLNVQPHKTIGPFEFIEAWQSAKSVAEVAERFGLSTTNASQRASYYRANGVPMKYLHTRNDWDSLADFAARIGEDE